MKAKPEHLSRTRFGQIVCEFLPAATKSNKVLILATGMPGYPGGSGRAIRALAERGYWVFVPRYRGSWESGGKFLAHSPHEDILELVSGLERGFPDLWSGKMLRIKEPQIHLIGASFGGPAVLLAARDRRIKKVVAISPVVDWRKQEGTTESIPFMARFIPRAFGEAYRADASAWKKLASGTFYNPVAVASSIPGKKVLIFHAQDDDVVPFMPARELAKKIGAQFVSFKKGGHGGTSLTAKPKYWRRIERFFKSR